MAGTTERCMHPHGVHRGSPVLSMDEQKQPFNASVSSILPCFPSREYANFVLGVKANIAASCIRNEMSVKDRKRNAIP